MGTCPFCVAAREALAKSPLCIAFADAFPVSPGHTLVVTRRHVETYFDCSPEERREIWELVQRVRDELSRSHNPDGFNVGWARRATIRKMGSS